MNTPPPPRATQGGVAARSAIIRATALTCLVRDDGPDTIGAYLDDLNLDQLYALVVTLAAMVPDDQRVDDLLGWVDDLGRRLELEEQRTAKARRSAA